MKVALVALHSCEKYTPLALLYLKAYLVEHKQKPIEDIEILEFSVQLEVPSIVDAILKSGAEVVGFSCYVWNILKVQDVARRLKGAHADIKIVWGGPEVGPISVSVLEKHPYVDVIVKSEGEIPFAEVVECFERGGVLTSVKGISYNNSGAAVENPNADILKDLNDLPTPHKSIYGDFKKRYICLETQRGCVFRCSFCFYNKDFSIRNRRFDLERVKSEILYWLNQDVSEIYLMDPIFNLDKARAKEICRFIIEHNDKKIIFHTEIWAEFVDAELADLFQKAGFYYLEVGLQTTEKSVLATVERRLKLEPFTNGIRYLTESGLTIELQLIYGLPGGTRKSFKEALDFAASLKPKVVAVFMLMILPGTELWKKADALGIVYDKNPFYHIKCGPNFSQEDYDYGLKVIDCVYTLYESKACDFFRREMNWRLSEMVDRWIEWNIEHVKVCIQNQPDPAVIRRTVAAFIEHYCKTLNVEYDFYREILNLEFPGVHSVQPPILATSTLDATVETSISSTSDKVGIAYR